MLDDLGDRVRAARVYAGINSQRELGERLGLSQSTIQRLETGARDMSKYDRETLLGRIADECLLPLAWFYADFTRLAEIVSDEDAIQLLEAEAERARLRLEGSRTRPGRTPRARGDEGRGS